jgi:hypothetical protein
MEAFSPDPDTINSAAPEVVLAPVQVQDNLVFFLNNTQLIVIILDNYFPNSDKFKSRPGRNSIQVKTSSLLKVIV